MAQPPQAVAADEVPPREYIFVLDVSGSMNGFPLDTAKTLMRDLVAVLRPTDTFNIVVFADGSQTLSRASIPATVTNLETALGFIGRKKGGGGTELLAAIKRALAIPRQDGVSRTVVLLTDGYIDAERSVFDYVRDHLDETNLFAFGIGSSVNRYLIEGLAHAGQGEPFIVTGRGKLHDCRVRHDGLDARPAYRVVGFRLHRTGREPARGVFGRGCRECRTHQLCNLAGGASGRNRLDDGRTDASRGRHRLLLRRSPAPV